MEVKFRVYTDQLKLTIDVASLMDKDVYIECQQVIYTTCSIKFNNNEERHKLRKELISFGVNPEGL